MKIHERSNNADSANLETRSTDSSDLTEANLNSTQLVGVLSSRPQTPVFIDARSILRISNPTELFLATAQPATAVATTLAVLERIKPWRILPGADANREWVRLLVVLALFPWTWSMWRRRAEELTANHNRELVGQLDAHNSKVVVFSTGFTALERPLIDSLGLRNYIGAEVVRWRGQQHLPSSQLVMDSSFCKLAKNALAVANSSTEPLLSSGKTPLVLEDTTPADPISTPRPYIPLRYIHLTKNPKGRFIEYAWLKDDLYTVLLAYSITTGVLFPLHAIGVVLASLALWITYEAGYHENDVLGEEREKDPVLPSNFAEEKGTVPTVLPWVWASALTVIASIFFAFGLGEPIIAAPLMALGWLAVIVAVRVQFWIFNRLPKPMRVIPHLLLQVGKYGGFAIISLMSPVGLGLVAAQVVYRWLPYAIYRWHPSKTFIKEPLTRTRLAVFALIAVPGFALNPTLLFGIQFVLGALLLGRRAVSTHLRVRKPLRHPAV